MYPNNTAESICTFSSDSPLAKLGNMQGEAGILAEDGAVIITVKVRACRLSSDACLKAHDITAPLSC